MIALKEQQLFEEIDILPIDLKTKIVDKILNSLNSSHKSIDDLWIKEVNKRKNDIENGSVKLINGEDVFEKIAKKFKTK